ncbi:MAG TPA: protein-disulfide reductase DsbD domain-containing protein [Chitinophagaceae bacterium]|nr:protein-disulfide reductase DsbD domain-containing protein [Chitinophagaceae bacterium]
MLKHVLIFVTILLLAADARSQGPVKWIFTVEKIDAQTYDVHLTATVQRPWHIYSMSSPVKGALPTKIVFSKNPLITLADAPRETGRMETKYEEAFGLEVKYYNDRVDFMQRVKIKGRVKTNLAGTIEFMVCNDTQCLPPQKLPFNIRLQ